jgi:predicted transcriptional regulator
VKNRAIAETQNITLALPKDVLRRVKRLAVEKETSVSRLLTEALQEVVHREDAYAAARQRALEAMEHPASLGTGGEARWTRQDLHER